MTQQEVMNLLKNNPKEWFTTNQMGLVLGLHRHRVHRAIKSMLKYNDVVLKIENRECRSTHLYKLNWRKKYI